MESVLSSWQGCSDGATEWNDQSSSSSDSQDARDTCRRLRRVCIFGLPICHSARKKSFAASGRCRPLPSPCMSASQCAWVSVTILSAALASPGVVDRSSFFDLPAVAERRLIIATRTVARHCLVERVSCCYCLLLATAYCGVVHATYRP